MLKREFEAVLDEYRETCDKELAVCALLRSVACYLCLGSSGLLECPEPGVEKTCQKWREL